MTPGEARARVLRDHVVLRAMLDRIEDRARAAGSASSSGAAELRAEGERLLDLLARHLRFEDDHLQSILLGAAVGARFEQGHAQQRELLEYEQARLRDTGQPAGLVARNLLDLAAVLRDDMAREEEAFGEVQA